LSINRRVQILEISNSTRLKIDDKFLHRFLLDASDIQTTKSRLCNNYRDVKNQK
jgi:hypothetical protein